MLEKERREAKASEARHKLTAETLRRQIHELQVSPNTGPGYNSRNLRSRREIQYPVHSFQLLQLGYATSAPGFQPSSFGTECSPVHMVYRTKPFRVSYLLLERCSQMIHTVELARAHVLPQLLYDSRLEVGNVQGKVSELQEEIRWHAQQSLEGGQGREQISRDSIISSRPVSFKAGGAPICLHLGLSSMP